MVHLFDHMRRADGTVPRPRSWQKALELCLRGHEYRWTSRKYHACDRSRTLPRRAEDFALTEPDLSIESLETVIHELMAENDDAGTRHWQQLLDDLHEWLGAANRDPWEPEAEPEAEPDETPEKARKAHEIDAFFAAINPRSASGSRTLALTRLLAFTGLRIGEALDLRMRDIDFAAGTVTVRRGKTPSARREVAMPADPEKVELLLKDMGRYLKHRASWNPTVDRVFVSTPKAGERATRGLSYQSVYRTFQRVSERAGIAPLSPHQLRHTYASILIGKGAAITGVQRQLGHANPQITLRTYAHCVSNEQREAAKFF